MNYFLLSFSILVSLVVLTSCVPTNLNNQDLTSNNVENTGLSRHKREVEAEDLAGLQGGQGHHGTGNKLASFMRINFLLGYFKSINSLINDFIQFEFLSRVLGVNHHAQSLFPMFNGDDDDDDDDDNGDWVEYNVEGSHTGDPFLDMFHSALESFDDAHESRSSEAKQDNKGSGKQSSKQNQGNSGNGKTSAEVSDGPSENNNGKNGNGNGNSKSDNSQNNNNNKAQSGKGQNKSQNNQQAKNTNNNGKQNDGQSKNNQGQTQSSSSGAQGSGQGAAQSKGARITQAANKKQANVGGAPRNVGGGKAAQISGARGGQRSGATSSKVLTSAGNLGQSKTSAGASTPLGNTAPAIAGKSVSSVSGSSAQVAPSTLNGNRAGGVGRNQQITKPNTGTPNAQTNVQGDSALMRAIASNVAKENQNRALKAGRRGPGVAAAAKSNQQVRMQSQNTINKNGIAQRPPVIDGTTASSISKPMLAAPASAGRPGASVMTGGSVAAVGAGSRAGARAGAVGGRQGARMAGQAAQNQFAAVGRSGAAVKAGGSAAAAASKAAAAAAVGGPQGARAAGQAAQNQFAAAAAIGNKPNNAIAAGIATSGTAAAGGAGKVRLAAASAQAPGNQNKVFAAGMSSSASVGGAAMQNRLALSSPPLNNNQKAFMTSSSSSKVVAGAPKLLPAQNRFKGSFSRGQGITGAGFPVGKGAIPGPKRALGRGPAVSRNTGSGKGYLTPRVLTKGAPVNAGVISKGNKPINKNINNNGAPRLVPRGGQNNVRTGVSPAGRTQG